VSGSTASHAGAAPLTASLYPKPSIDSGGSSELRSPVWSPGPAGETLEALKKRSPGGRMVVSGYLPTRQMGFPPLAELVTRVREL
jgi:hypothetical protein